MVDNPYKYPYVPVGGVIAWDGTGLTGAPDLSTPEKVAAVYGYGKDFKVPLQYICPDALLVPQVDYGSGMNFRCFGNTNANSLSTMIGKTIKITLYYL